MSTIALLYLMLGSYVAGTQYQERLSVWIVFYVLCGPILLLVAIVADALKPLQLKAFFDFYVMGKYRDKDAEWLEYANKIARMHGGLRGWAWRFLIKRINKANHYFAK